MSTRHLLSASALLTAMIVFALLIPAVTAAAIWLADPILLRSIVAQSAAGASRLGLFQPEHVTGIQRRAGIAAVAYLAVAALFGVFGARFVRETGAELRQKFREGRWISQLDATDRLHLLCLAAASALGAILAAMFLDQTMRNDEAMSFLWFGTRSIIVSLGYYWDSTNHVLHSLLMRTAVALFGDDPWAIRLPAAIAATCCIPALYLAGRRLFDRDVGLVAALTFAGTAYWVEQATNARGYSLVILAFLSGLAVLPSLLKGSRLAGVTYVTTSALGAWSVPVMIYPFSIGVTWLVLATVLLLPVSSWMYAARRILATVLATGGLVLLLYSPTLVATGIGATEPVRLLQAAQRLSPATRINSILTQFTYVWEQWTYPAPWWLAIGTLALTGVGALSAMCRTNSYGQPFALALLLGPMSIFVVTGLSPLPYWALCFFFPLYLLMLSHAGLQIWRWFYGTDSSTPVVAVTAGAVFVAAASATALSRYPGDFPNYVGYHDAEQAAKYTYKYLGEPARFIMSGTHFGSIDYYLYKLHGRHGVQATPWDSSRTGHVFVVVDRDATDRNHRAEEEAANSILRKVVAENFSLFDHRDLPHSEITHYVPLTED